MIKEEKVEKYLQKARETHGNKYDYSLFQENFSGSSSKISVICRIHGEFKQNAWEHAKGAGCQKCAFDARTNKWEEMKARFREIHQNKYDYSLSQASYKDSRSTINIICPIHGKFKLIACKHMQGRECRSCHSWKYYLPKFIEKHGTKYDYSLAEKTFKTCESMITIICPDHGEFKQRASNHVHGNGCLICSNRIPITTDKWIARFNDIHDNFYDYSLLDDTIKTYLTKIEIICPDHGRFWQKIAYHIEGCKCPKCKMSKGALKVFKFLHDHDIPYIDQHKFEDLVGINDGLLRFDFYLPETEILIEYDGQQHFRAMGVFGGEEIFERVQIHDKLKDEYAKNNNIRLIRIPYWDIDNIEEILTRELNLKSDPPAI